MPIRFNVTLAHQEEDLRAVIYDIHACIDDELTPDQEVALEPLFDPLIDEYVLGRLKATRHASPAINLTAMDREQEKNPYLALNSDIEDRLCCHADDLTDELKAHSHIGDAAGLIVITSLDLHPSARGQTIGRMLLYYLRTLHAGTAYFAALAAEPWMKPGTPWNEVCQAGHDLTMYLCLEDSLKFEPIVTCDGINLLVAFWDSDEIGAPDEYHFNLATIIRQLETQ